MASFDERAAAPARHLPWLLWKAHRLYLKKFPGWRALRFPSGQSLRVKYLAEGESNYVFRVENDARLLKISKRQYYNLGGSEDRELTQTNCALANQLASAGLAVASDHLFGGAVLVEHAGVPLPHCRAVPRAALSLAFAGLGEWSLRSRIVLLDIGDDNWCWDGQRVRLCDVDVRWTCALDRVTEDPMSRRRLGDPPPTRVEEALMLFLEQEESLLRDILEPRGVFA